MKADDGLDGFRNVESDLCVIMYFRERDGCTVHIKNVWVRDWEEVFV